MLGCAVAGMLLLAPAAYSWHGSISGTKFNDVNANGQRDAGEPGLAGWTIYAFADLDNDGQHDVGELRKTVVTGANGSYKLDRLPYYDRPYKDPQKYVVSEVQQPGWTCSFPAAGCQHVVMISQAREDWTGVDFGNHQPPAPAPPSRGIEAPSAAPATAGETAAAVEEQPAVAVLGVRRVSGQAALRGPSECVDKSFRAAVTGRSIRRVTYYLNGRLLKRVDAVAGRTRFPVRVSPRGLGRGPQRLIAKVVFTPDSATRPRTLPFTFHRCARGAQAPQFTG